MKKLLFFTLTTIILNVNSCNPPTLNAEQIAAMKQNVATARANLQNQINKDTARALIAGVGSKVALVGTFALVSRQQYRQQQLKMGLLCGGVYGLLETYWVMTLSKIANNRANAQALELINAGLPAQNALPNDKNQQ